MVLQLEPGNLGENGIEGGRRKEEDRPSVQGSQQYHTLPDVRLYGGCVGYATYVARYTV